MFSIRMARTVTARWLCILLFLGCAAHAQTKCNVEIKILLSPTETQAAVAALNFKKETAGRVYFFDTSALDLLGQGLIIRLRQGAGDDLTVKLRPRGGAKPFAPSNIGEEFDCEIDLIGGCQDPRPTRFAAGTPGQICLRPEAKFGNCLMPGKKRLLKERRRSPSIGPASRESPTSRRKVGKPRLSPASANSRWSFGSGRGGGSSNSQPRLGQTRERPPTSNCNSS